MGSPITSLRARRLIALLGMLKPGTDLPLEQLSSAIGVSPAELAGDLETLSVCGVWPYDPGSLVPVYVEDGVVHVYGDLPALDTTVRLAMTEAVALVAVLQQAGYSSDDPLIQKLRGITTTEFSAEELSRVLGATTSPAGAYQILAPALENHEAVRIVYRAGGSTVDTERVIEPLALRVDRGTWYVEAFCRRVGALRTFRLDRIRSTEATGEHFVPRTVELAETAFDPQGLPHARIRMRSGEDISEREWPGMRVQAEEPGGVVIEVPYAGTEWIARQVAARLGAAEALEPAEVREAVRRIADAERDG